jgi:hypothetical protein
MGDPKNPLHMTHDLSVLSDGELDALSRILPKLGGSTEADAADGDVPAGPRRTTASPRGQGDGGDRKGLRKAKTPANRGGGLLNFVRYFWHTLEPKTRPMIEGWVVEAICLHLEAITFGDIPSNRLLINVPPGF